MVEYIKKEDALSFPFANGQYDHKNADEHFIFGCETYKEWLEQIPAVDVIERKSGKWNRTDAYPHRLYCSVCYKTYLKNDELLERWEFPLKFCPNCGADMRGVDNG